MFPVTVADYISRAESQSRQNLPQKENHAAPEPKVQADICTDTIPPNPDVSVIYRLHFEVHFVICVHSKWMRWLIHQGTVPLTEQAELSQAIFAFAAMTETKTPLRDNLSQHWLSPFFLNATFTKAAEQNKGYCSFSLFMRWSTQGEGSYYVLKKA